MGKKPRDFSKEQIGQLKPLYIDENKPRGAGKNIYWICKCSCGNLISVNSCNLQSGLKNNRNMSCGKCHIYRKDLTNQRFGKLTAISMDLDYPSTKENNWRTKWICKCDCGNIVSVFTNNLTKSHTTSCGCANRSIGEENIEKILIDNNIKYAKEYSFNDLKNKKLLRFDFAIFNMDNTLSHLIEFDGRQHTEIYTPWNSIETLEERQYRDELKNLYCQENNIKLIRIPYGKRDNLTLNDLI